MPDPAISVVIPTYQREQVLIDTTGYLLKQLLGVGELIIVDQTPEHDPAVHAQLDTWERSGTIRWIRLDRPSITRAMNQGWIAAKGSIIAFVDDDIVPDESFVSQHIAAHVQHPGAIVAGRVLQPWHMNGSQPRTGFAADKPAPTTEFMGGNFSLSRRMLIELGGFDENFVHVAYRFEAEFSLRARRAGVPIVFWPEASIEHLKVASGGTRSYGDHLRTIKPSHAVGEYYFLMGSRPSGWFRRMVLRIGRSAVTRHHLRRPWWIPVTIAAEIAGLVWAVWLVATGKKLVEVSL
jgi:GT2 family glycosyltransferase